MAFDAGLVRNSDLGQRQAVRNSSHDAAASSAGPKRRINRNFDSRSQNFSEAPMNAVDQKLMAKTDYHGDKIGASFVNRLRSAVWHNMETPMLHKILVVSTAVAAIAVYSAVSQPVEARSCNAVLAKGRGLDEATASARSLKHLTNRINHWAAKNKLGKVSVGHRSTACSNQGVSVCTSSAKVCG